MFEPAITLNGNLVDDPELRYVSNGSGVCKLRIAQTSRIKSGLEWKDGETLFINVDAWDKLGENAAASLQRGMGVIVTGTLRQRSWETHDGEKRTVFEVRAEDIGISLKREAVMFAEGNHLIEVPM